MKKTVSAFAPGNISLLFQVIAGKSPTETGSKGVGFTLHEGATARVSQSHVMEITYNGNSIELPTVTTAIQSLTHKPLSISITSPLPLGSGFGMSGASALASVFATNALLSLGKSERELATIAHTADVTQKTGLGDVANQYYGGFFAKFVSSAQFVVTQIPIRKIPIYCISYGKLLTSSILSNTQLVQTINKEADIALGQIQTLLQKNTTLQFGDLTTIVNTYTKNTKLITPKLARCIADIEKRGGHAAMILLGDAIVSDIPFEGSMKLHMDTKKAALI
jgi:pantoate kinase